MVVRLSAQQKELSAEGIGSVQYLGQGLASRTPLGIIFICGKKLTHFCSHTTSRSRSCSSGMLSAALGQQIQQCREGSRFHHCLHCRCQKGVLYDCQETTLRTFMHFHDLGGLEICL